jgi:hypothetical protein
MTNDDDTDPGTLGEGSPRGGEGLASGGAPKPGEAAPDPDNAAAGAPRGGEGLANVTPATTAVPDPDEAVQGSPRGGEGLADDAA